MKPIIYFTRKNTNKRSLGFEWTNGHDLAFFRVEAHVVLLGLLRNAVDVVLQR